MGSLLREKRRTRKSGEILPRSTSADPAPARALVDTQPRRGLILSTDWMRTPPMVQRQFHPAVHDPASRRWAWAGERAFLDDKGTLETGEDCHPQPGRHYCMHFGVQDVFVSWPRTPQRAPATPRRQAVSIGPPVQTGGQTPSMRYMLRALGSQCCRFQPLDPVSSGGSGTREGTSIEHKCRCNRQTDINVVPHACGKRAGRRFSKAKCASLLYGMYARVGARFALSCVSLRHGTIADVRQRVGIFAPVIH
jgi:hypothetical protein